MATPKPIPLYPVYLELCDISLNDYPQLQDKVSNMYDWQRLHWNWGKMFLEYIGRNKSEHTYTRFRNEVEKFLLWCNYVKEKPIDSLKKSDILEYADFCWKPPV